MRRDNQSGKMQKKCTHTQNANIRMDLYPLYLFQMTLVKGVAVYYSLPFFKLGNRIWMLLF